MFYIFYLYIIQTVWCLASLRYHTAVPLVLVSARLCVSSSSWGGILPINRVVVFHYYLCILKLLPTNNSLQT